MTLLLSSIQLQTTAHQQQIIQDTLYSSNHHNSKRRVQFIQKRRVIGDPYNNYNAALGASRASSFEQWPIAHHDHLICWRLRIQFPLNWVKHWMHQPQIESPHSVSSKNPTYPSIIFSLKANKFSFIKWYLSFIRFLHFHNTENQTTKKKTILPDWQKGLFDSSWRRSWPATACIMKLVPEGKVQEEAKGSLEREGELIKWG